MIVRFASVAVLCICATRVDAQSTAIITAADLRARLSALAHDSTGGRETGQPGHAVATRYIANELQRMGATPGGAGNSYFQTVPLRMVSSTVTSARLQVAADNLKRGVDYLPLLGMSGVPFPRAARVYQRDLVYGGRLGDGESFDSTLTKDKIVLFEAPLRDDGQPDYQVWAYAKILALHKKAHAVWIASLDFMPGSVVDRFTTPWMELEDAWRLEPGVPPVIAVTRATASFARSKRSLGGSVSFETTVTPLEGGSRNVVAFVRGRDPALATSFVIVSAHSDHLGRTRDSLRGGVSVFRGANAGSGAAALLELAEYFASDSARPKRSIAFVWTTGEEQGFLGEKCFLEHPTFGHGRTFAHVRVDPIGRADSGMLGCAPGGPSNAAAEFQTVTVVGPTSAVDRTANERVEDVNFDRFAAATRQLAAFVNTLASPEGSAVPSTTRDQLLATCRGQLAPSR
ncbi:MAG TPA: M28 family peptidase [Gemmatimonadaceae bacterium]|nr:M28 family peptidase [Gemmatimonadaceae bacterium]